MPEEKTQTNEQSTTEKKVATTDSNYREAFEKLKGETVSKALYEQALSDNKKWIDDYASGKLVRTDAESTKVEVATTEEEAKKLRKELFEDGCDNLSALDFWTKTLQLRKYDLDNGKKDPFVANGVNIHGSEMDYETAEKVARTVQECIDQANGNSEVFTSLLQSKMVDTGPRYRY